MSNFTNKSFAGSLAVSSFGEETTELDEFLLESLRLQRESTRAKFA